MRLALVSDIHGNEIALRAVLEDLDRVGVDRIACLGDVATLGPRPVETIALLRERCSLFVAGNHDTFILEPEKISAYTSAPIIVEAIEWCRDLLGDEERTFLATFRSTVEVPLDDHDLGLLCHGSPRSNTEDVLATTPPDSLEAMLGVNGRPSPLLVACGHTHIQMLRQHRGTLVVNPGSVGMPFLEYTGGKRPTLLPHAEYAILEISKGTVRVSLARVSYDREAALADVAASDSPLRAVILG